MSELNDEAVKTRMEEAEQTARDYFRQGLNCSECVLLTFMKMNNTNLPKEVLSLSSGFGGGIGQTKHICGAISGAVMALGSVKGRRDPFEIEEVRERAMQLKEVYKPFGDMTREIKENYGTLNCDELSNPYGDFECKERKKNCQQIIGYCAAIAVKYADK